MYYEPIEIPKDITTPDLAPQVGLFSKSRGEATESEPLFGVTAWEPLLNPDYFPSKMIAERCFLQRKALYDAWRYLVAKTPAQVAKIKLQLQGSHRQTKLLNELDKARKARSNSIKQRERARVKKLRSRDPNAPVESIEKSDDEEDDSGLGSDTDEDAEDDDDDDEDRRRMPPPSHVTSRRPPEPRRNSVASSELFMSGGRGSSIDAEDDDDADLDIRPRAGSAAPLSGRKTPFTAAKSVKRKQSSGPDLQRNSRARTEGKGVFVTPPASGRPPGSQRDVDDDTTLDMMSGLDANDGLHNDAAFDEGLRRSKAPGEDGHVFSENGGLNEDDAEEAAMRNSLAPESDIDV